MTAYWITGHTLDVLRAMPDDSVDLVLTSPPFLALRSYLPADDPAKPYEIGSEATPGEFLDVLLDVTEELRRVLAPHGSIAVELGDTYSGSTAGGGDDKPEGEWTKYKRGNLSEAKAIRRDGAGWPEAKSLCLVPELYRFALAYGVNPLTGRTTPRWRVRNVVRWVRPNPPVGALGDKFRPATSDMVIATVARDRYFDLDAVRTPGSSYDRQGERKGRISAARDVPNHSGSAWMDDRPLEHHPAGAPPLDWWEVPTHPYVTPDGLIVVPSGGIAHRVRVPVGAPADDIRRTASPDCPVHGSPDHPGPSGADGGRGEGESSRSGHSGSRPAPEPQPGSAPMQQTIGLLDGSPASSPAGSPAAKPRSTASHRTGPAPSTSHAGTPSARTTGRTGDMSAPPESSAPHPDTPASSSAEACRPAGEHETPPRTAHTSDPSSACTCSYWVELDVASEPTSDYATWPGDAWNIPTHGYAGSHYATWPPALLERPIKAMCPTRVCQVCGQPSRRIVEAERTVVYPQKASTAARSKDPGFGEEGHTTRTTLGWTDCGHDAWRPGRVLDCFGGSGTTGQVATGHGRDFLGVDLDSRNEDLARDRIGPMFFKAITVAELGEVFS